MRCDRKRRRESVLPIVARHMKIRFIVIYEYFIGF